MITSALVLTLFFGSFQTLTAEQSYEIPIIKADQKKITRLF